MDSRLIAVVFVLCLGLLGGALAAEGIMLQEEPAQTEQEAEDSQGMSVTAAENTSEYLAPQPNTIDRWTQGTASIDVASAVDAQAKDIRVRFRQETLESEFENASTEQERRVVIQDGTEQVSNRVDHLEQQHDEAIQQYAAGETRETELYGTLAAVHQEAKSLESTIIWLENTADQLGMEAEQTQLSADRARIISLHGPVRSNIKESIEGEESHRIHVDIANRGIVLATISQDESTVVYTREAYNPDAQSNQPDQYSGELAQALARFDELYPWVAQSGEGLSAGTIGETDARSYRFESTHPHGELETYLDGGSGNIFYEVQRINPEALPTTTAEATDESGELRLEVDRTRGCGPLGITVLDTTTDEPVDATIELNGEVIGSTNGDRLWTINQPGQLTINATQQQPPLNEVSLSLDPRSDRC